VGNLSKIEYSLQIFAKTRCNKAKIWSLNEIAKVCFILGIIANFGGTNTVGAQKFYLMLRSGKIFGIKNKINLEINF
jgi:hypothetical protein